MKTYEVKLLITARGSEDYPLSEFEQDAERVFGAIFPSGEFVPGVAELEGVSVTEIEES